MKRYSLCLLKFFKPVSLPTVEQTGLPDHAVSSANHVVEKMLEKERHQLGEDPASGGRKQKYTMTFTVEDHAKIGKYAAKNGVTRAQKHFKQLNLSESPVHNFKKK